MKFTFDYTETLSRRVTIEAKSFIDAAKEITRRIDAEEIVLDAEDFIGGEITMPLEENSFPRIQLNGEIMKDNKGIDILIDCW